MKPFSLLFAVVLLVMWLMLNTPVTFRDVLLGSVLAVALLLAAAPLRPLHARVRRARVAVRLIGAVLADVVRSNIGVARVILGLVHGRTVRQGLMQVPLAMRDPHGLAALAMIITSTPGTAWVDLAPDRMLTIHVLDLVDEAEWVRRIKQRYERPLMEIFE